MLELEVDEEKDLEEHPKGIGNITTHVSVKGLGLKGRLKAIHVVERDKQKITEMLKRKGFQSVEVKTKAKV